LRKIATNLNIIVETHVLVQILDAISFLVDARKAILYY